jgi:hypothetical protein
VENKSKKVEALSAKEIMKRAGIKNMLEGRLIHLKKEDKVKKNG